MIIFSYGIQRDIQRQLLLQLLRLLELPSVSLHLLIFLKLLEQQISRWARKKETKLGMISGIRKRLWLLTKGNWNQKQSKSSFRGGGEEESNVEHWQGERGQQERIKNLRSCFWTEVIRRARFVQASTNFQSAIFASLSSPFLCSCLWNLLAQYLTIF